MPRRIVVNNISRCGDNEQTRPDGQLFDNDAPGGSTGSYAWHSWIVLRSTPGGDI